MHESAIKGPLPMMGQSDYKKQGESRIRSNLNCMENFSTLVLSMFIVVQMTLERLQMKIRRSLSRHISFKLLTVAILLVFSSFKRQGSVGLFKGNGTAVVGLTSILLRPTRPTTALLLFGSFLFFLLQFRTEKHKDQKSPPLPPGPMPWPIVGNLIKLVMNKPAFRWILRLMKEMNTEIACIKLGNVHVIPVTSPEIGREFLKKHDAIFASRPLTMASEYLSRGYLSAATAPLGDQWKKMRRVVANEVLGPARLKWLVNKRVEEADNLVRYLYNQCRSSRVGDGAVVNVRVATRQYSGNVIRKMMFNQRYFGMGHSDGGPGVEEEEHVEALFTMLSLLYAFCVSDYMSVLRRLDLDGHEKILKKAMKVVNKYHEPIIDGRIKKWRSGADGRVRKEPEDLLDILISVQDTDGKPLLTPEEIKAQELMFATVDNPSNAAEWAMAEMLNQPEVLKKALEELDSVVGRERLVQESDFHRLNYIKACAREAFRLPRVDC
ncbi:phenylalanine N-monooxygenase [Cinnamomum micranthum f. kanehirae]|uniref:Phenylalanine N-monooxygenase n=1 Tax=Cinnamomum micranthum f. kanehirae TaxID=337451 RepID=A0A3S3MQA8_9MAGN|nr:phenylalanine N-monooxygenase [Cinnamomum micranthum f. kanehirae]